MTIKAVGSRRKGAGKKKYSEKIGKKKKIMYNKNLERVLLENDNEGVNNT